MREGKFAGVWGGVEKFFKLLRSKGGRAAVAVDPLSSHDCGNQRYLAIPWLDACLTARLPEKNGAPLKPVPVEEAWGAPFQPGATSVPVPLAKLEGAPEKSVWLPNAAVAKDWAQYVADTAVVDSTPPPAPTGVRVAGNELSWEAEADLESGLGHFLIERDGEFLARVPEQNKNPFGRPLFQNLSYSDTPTQPLVLMRFTDTKPQPGKKHEYRVVAVNTVGLKSEPAGVSELKR